MDDNEELGSDYSEELSDISVVWENEEESGDEGEDGATNQGLQSYMFQPYETASEGGAEEVSGEDGDDDLEDIGRLQNTEWCTCDNCQAMPLVVECQCCKELHEVVEEIKRMGDDPTCMTETHRFANVCLDPEFLRVANYAFMDHHGRHGPQQAQQHERYRYIAYRQFVRMYWGHLGRHQRVPLPACVVSKVRATFPSPSADYVGFNLPNLE